MTEIALRYQIKIPQHIDFSLPILVVQSQQDLRLIMVHHLQKLSFSKVIQCSNAIEALEVISKTEGIQAIICDYLMPNMSAADFLAEIKNNYSLGWAPTVVSMETPSQEKIMLMVESGAEEIMAKPFTLGDIMPKVKSAFAKFHNPKNPEKVYELAKEELRKKNTSEATKIYEALAESSPNSARPVVGLANAAHINGKFDEALQLLNKAKQKNEKFVHIYVNEGQWLSEQKKWSESLAAFKKAIGLSPLNGFRYKVAAEILSQQKKYEDIKTLLTEALSKDVNFPELHNHLSQACFALKDFKGSIRSVKQALALEPNNVVFLNQLGISYKELGMQEDAMKVYNSVIKIDPDNIPALFNKGILCKDDGHLEEAMKIFERISKKKKDFPPALQQLDEIKSLLAKKAQEKKAG